MFDVIISTAADKPSTFRLAFPILLHQVRRGIITLSAKYIERFLEEFGDLLKQYAFSRSEEFQRLLVALLTVCLPFCNLDEADARDVDHQFNDLCAWIFEVLQSKKFKSWSLRDDLSRFLLAYITAFSSERPGALLRQRNASQVEDEGLSLQDAKENPDDIHDLGVPTALVLRLNEDVDMRVRFRAAVINAHLYSFLTEEDFPAIQLYDHMRQRYTTSLDKCVSSSHYHFFLAMLTTCFSYEHMLTRMLSLGNIMITSSAVRRGPYWHLLETCAYSQQYSTHIEAILNGVSARLGFSSLSVIFESYASQIAYSMSQQDLDFSTFPPHLLGYRDKANSAEAAFRPCAPVNVWMGHRLKFEKHSKMLGKTALQGLEDCFGDIVGYGLLLQVEHHSPDDIWTLLQDEMRPMENFEVTFQENVDSTIVMILRCLGDQEFRKGGNVTAVLSGINSDVLSAFKQLNIHRVSETSILHTPNLPNYSAQVIVQCLQWVSSKSSRGFSSATTYHVVQALMNDIHQTPLVNEQQRLVTAMTMWLAYRVEDLEDLTVMRTLLNGATLMMSQSDLARTAQSILEFCFKRYRSLKIKDPYSKTPTLPDVLLRVCCIAQDYSSCSDQQLSKIGFDLLGWVDKQVQLFAELPSFQGIVQKVLAAWPLSITDSHPLASMYNGISMHGLTSALEDHHITSNKFRLVQRIYENAAEFNGGEDEYAKTYFWRLKECMPLSSYLQGKDIIAFVGLLYINRGNIATYNPERPDLNLPRLRHRRLVKLHAAAQDAKCIPNSQDAITTGLLVMLEDSSPLFVANAYHTLRLIFAALADNATSRPIPTLPTEYHADVSLLKEYKRLPFHRHTVVDVRDALKSDEYRTSVDNFRRWISLIVVLFCDTLQSIDNFYGQLNSTLVSHESFAEEIMPILVQTLLQLEKERKFPGLSYTLHDTLSEYFEFVLQSSLADLSCIRSIVDLVLHLRYFAPRSKDLLAYNKWLRIDYVLLARSAILCGAYTTALLFVEIALEDSKNNASSVEQVLYEIYAHIDEPDGFYGIHTNDLQQFLVKRYHHERQWDKAFRFHGASLEAGDPSKTGTDGLVKSFHHFGFDHLAMDTLRGIAQGSSDAGPSLSTNYRLGWRTETWDLPIQSTASPGAPLYSSLRAIYRERDLSSLHDVVQAALTSEMDHLRSLGSENLAEIRVVNQELMSLREVLRWTDQTIQKNVGSYHLEPDNCQDLLMVDPKFRYVFFIKNRT